MGSIDRRRLATASMFVSVALTYFLTVVGGMSQEALLQHRLEAVGSITPRSVKVRFVLTNLGNETIRILPRNTPLSESIGTRMFTIRCFVDHREEILPFQGPLHAGSDERGSSIAKDKGEEGLNNAIWMKPNEAKEAVVDLSSVYKFPDSAKCEVVFKGLITIIRRMDRAPGLGPDYEFAQSTGSPLFLEFRS